MNILVTGGAGYIGSHAHHRLLDEGHTVSVIDDLSHGHEWAIDPRARFYCGNISDQNLVREILRKDQIEAVMHFAAFIEVGESVQFPQKYFDNNHLYALKLLSAMREEKVQKFIFSSTAAVYGNPTAIPVTEDEPCKPINPYGESKRRLEASLLEYRQTAGLQFIALRYFNVAGARPDGKLGEAHEPESHLIPRILLCALRGEPVSIFGHDYETRDGTCIRDYVHVEDLVSAHLLALENVNSAPSRFYNLGSEQGFSVREILRACSDVVGRTIESREHARRPGDPPVLIASRKRIMSELGWKPCFGDIHQIVRDAWNWHKSRI
jgi:UDP-glucose 4-epimerase